MPSSLLLCGLLAAGLAASLLLFVSLKREIQAHRRRDRSQANAILARLKEAETPRDEPIFVPVPLRAGLNLNKRVQALRLLRRGEDVAHIAAVLLVPRREVELMIRVHEASRARAATAGDS